MFKKILTIIVLSFLIVGCAKDTKELDFESLDNKLLELKSSGELVFKEGYVVENNLLEEKYGMDLKGIDKILLIETSGYDDPSFVLVVSSSDNNISKNFAEEFLNTMKEKWAMNYFPEATSLANEGETYTYSGYQISVISIDNDSVYKAIKE